MNKFARNICEANNLKYDDASECYSGVKSGYPLLLCRTGNTHELIFSVMKNGFPDPVEFKTLAKDCTAIHSCKVSGYKVTFVLKTAIGPSAVAAKVALAIDTVIRFLSSNGYIPCCEESGEQDEVAPYIVSGQPKILSSNTFLNMAKVVSDKDFEISKKHENIFAGFAGALIGSVIASIGIIIIAQLGYVSIFGGILMGILTIKGYELLAGKLSIKGIVVSAIIMIAMVYLSNQLDWAITIMNEFKVSIGEAFTSVNYVVEVAELKSTYYGNLGLLYLFTLAGSVPMMISAFKQNKVKNTAHKM